MRNEGRLRNEANKSFVFSLPVPRGVREKQGARFVKVADCCSEAGAGKSRPCVARAKEWSLGDFAPSATCDKGVGRAVSLNRVGGKMFEHLPKIKTSLRARAFANLFERYQNSRNHARTRFLRRAKDLTSLPKVSKLVWGKLGGNVRICSFFANIDSARHRKRARGRISEVD
jgi:hypothetical protein